MNRKQALFILCLFSFLIFTSNFNTYFYQPTVKAQAPPSINKVTPNSARLEGGTEIIISGSNFTSDSIIFFGKDLVKSPKITNSEIRFSIPPQAFPGNKTITIKNSFGQAQKEFAIRAKSLSELKTGEITTIAGGVPFVGDGEMATKASFVPISIAADKSGNILISDRVNRRIRQINNSGVINSLAGTGLRGFGPDNMAAVTSSLASPAGIAVDSLGNILVTDTSLFRLLKIDAKTGLINTIAGTGAPSFGGDGDLAVDANLRFPIGAAADNAGNIFIIDNTRIRQIDGKTGVINTIAGFGSSSADNIPALESKLASPQAILADKQGNLLISDTFSHRIRKIDATTKVITTIVGNGKAGFSGDGSLAIDASLSQPFGIALDEQGNLFIADFGNARVRRVDTNGIITTVAGNGNFDFFGDGGQAVNASFSPVSVAIRNTNLVIADFFSKRIRQVDSNGIITTIGGNGFSSLSNDGSLATDASVSIPVNITSDDKGNLFVAETENNRIRRIDSQTGIISTVAGNGKDSFSGDGGLAINAGLSSPGGMAIDLEKNLLFIADFNNLRVRQVNLTTGIITTVAGNGQIVFAGDGGPAVNATLNSPLTVALDKSGLFILDAGNNRVRRVDLTTGIITTIAGRDCPDFNCPLGDGGLATNANLLFLDPDFFFAQGDIQVDNKGNLLIADSFQYRIRQVDSSNIINTIIGKGTGLSSGDGGNAAQAGFTSLNNLALDAQGNTFISDSIRIRQVDSNKIIKTIAGTRSGYSGDGALATNASLSSAGGLVLNNGILYFCDVSNNAIRAIKISESTTVKSPIISNASFKKPNLTINGANFDLTTTMVKVNGQDVSNFISNRSSSAITVTANKKKLNLKKGSNSIIVITNGLSSNIFSLSL